MADGGIVVDPDQTFPEDFYFTVLATSWQLYGDRETLRLHIYDTHSTKERPYNELEPLWTGEPFSSLTEMVWFSQDIRRKLAQFLEEIGFENRAMEHLL